MTARTTSTTGGGVAGARPVEHFDVVIVGAGLSGIGAGHYIQSQCPWATYAVFEARESMGGTWDLFRYPGVRSDSDMYTLGYRFRPWDGRKTIADGDSILDYIKETAREEGVEKHIRFSHRVTGASWSSAQAQWTLTVQRTDTGERSTVTCGFLFSCTGYYRYDHGYQPDFPDVDRYRGVLVHPQHWPEDLDYAGKEIVVIGSGATAVTLVPAMAETAGHVTMLQRSPTYVVSVPGSSPVAKLLRRVLPPKLASEAIRWFHAFVTQGSYALSKRRPALVKRILRAGLERQLPKGFDIDTHFTPTYDPWDQRLCACPDGDLFKALSNGSASVVTDHIDRFTDDGILLRSGRELRADIVVSATGLELLFAGGMEITIDGDPIDLPGKMVYKGMMLQDVPNFAVAVGYTNASWTLKCELTCEYVTRLLNHMRLTGSRVCTPVNSDGSVAPAPLLGLNSGYINRAADRFPKQGNAYPWQVHQSYLRDYRALHMSPVEDDAMVFSR
ncbi:MAG TPA: NAD(P)/FAD-dependent oxidoreductase [Acidimicrobiales bacterium]|nr:NAD(P)/FAD-dependent oxidoreductase [Acidimicrobiales bacterium]